MYVHVLSVSILLPQQLLKEEISILKEKVEHHPEVTRFAMENLELRGMFKLLMHTFLRCVLDWLLGIALDWLLCSDIDMAFCHEQHLAGFLV